MKLWPQGLSRFQWRSFFREMYHILSHSLGSSDPSLNEHDMPTTHYTFNSKTVRTASSHRMAHYAFPPSAGLHWRDLEMSRVSWSLELKPLKHQPAPWNVQLFSLITTHFDTTWHNDMGLAKGTPQNLLVHHVFLKKMLIIMIFPYFFTIKIAFSLWSSPSRYRLSPSQSSSPKASLSPPAPKPHCPTNRRPRRLERPRPSGLWRY